MHMWNYNKKKTIELITNHPSSVALLLRTRAKSSVFKVETLAGVKFGKKDYKSSQNLSKTS